MAGIDDTPFLRLPPAIGAAAGYPVHRNGLDWTNWLDALDWAAPVRLSDEGRAVAGRMASYSAVAEQTGYLTASLLALTAPGMAESLMFATAIRDEAVHVEAFDRLRRRFGVDRLPANPHMLRTQAANMRADMSYVRRLAVHSALESFAIDEFGLLSAAFSADLAGQVYACVRQDEARHVALGVQLLRSHFAASDAARHDVAAGLQEAIELTGIDLAFYDDLAGWAGRRPDEVRTLFRSNFDKRWGFAGVNWSGIAAAAAVPAPGSGG